MSKFLIGLASFAICIGILLLGGYLSYTHSDFDGMTAELMSAINTPTFPGLPDVGGDENNGGNEGGNDPGEGPEQGGESTMPEGPDQGGSGSTKPEDPEQGGSGSTKPEDPEQGGSGSTKPEDPEQGGSGSTKPEDPEQDGSGSTKPEDPEQGGSGSTKPEDPDTPPVLSSEETKDAYKNMYDNNDPTYHDVKKELFVSMLQGVLGSNPDDGGNEGGEDIPDDTEPDLGLDDDFSTDFDPDSFEPEEDSEEDQEENLINDIVASIGGIYFDNLQKEIQASQEANASATEEEKNAARDDFAEKEAEAISGLINILSKPEETTKEDISQSVDALLDSPVCKNTISQSIENNPEFTETVQEKTKNLKKDIKAEIQEKLESAKADDPESAQTYQDIADLFGITLGSDIEIPGDIDIPEDLNH